MFSASAACCTSIPSIRFNLTALSLNSALQRCPAFGSLTLAILTPAPVAALGMRSRAGSMYPAEYQVAIFATEHGSWSRNRRVGYCVGVARLEGVVAPGEPVRATDWLQGARAWGSPVDIETMPNGSLQVSDDRAGAFYRVTYARP